MVKEEGSPAPVNVLPTVVALQTGPMVLLACLIIGCIATGVILAVLIPERAPPIVTASVLACGVTVLLYGILGGVSKAGFELGPLEMGGSAAVLFALTWLFNGYLNDQQRVMREDNYRFNQEEHVLPKARKWIAIERTTAKPINVGFKDPVSGDITRTGTILPIDLPLTLVQDVESGGNNFFIKGKDTQLDQRIARVNLSEILKNSQRDLSPETVYGPQRLHLVRAGKLPRDAPREWGSSDCLGTRLPMLVRAIKFDNEQTDFEVTPCGTSNAELRKRSSLFKREAILMSLTIEGSERLFLIAILSADHTSEPLWSNFLVIELKEA